MGFVDPETGGPPSPPSPLEQALSVGEQAIATNYRLVAALAAAGELILYVRFNEDATPVRYHRRFLELLDAYDKAVKALVRK